jgi:hypothetical protein
MYTCSFTKTLTGQLNDNGLGYKPHTNTVTARANDDEDNVATEQDSETVTFFWRGRTPGYWKNHPGAWPSPYTPNTLVQSVFQIPTCLKTGSNLDLTKPNGPDTMLQALDYQGGTTLKGKAQILFRASVAAVLNERHFGATYPPYTSTAQLITAVNNALASCDGATYINLATQLDFWNNGVH